MDTDHNMVVLRYVNIPRSALIIAMIMPLMYFVDIISYQEKVYCLIIAGIVCCSLFIFGFKENIYIEDGTLYFEIGFPTIGKSKKGALILSDIAAIEQVSTGKVVNSNKSMSWVNYYVIYCDGKTVEAPLSSVFHLFKFRDEVARFSSSVKFVMKVRANV